MDDEFVEKATSLLGLDKVKGVRDRGETRLPNSHGPATLLDSSATVSYDSEWWKNKKNALEATTTILQISIKGLGEMGTDSGEQTRTTENRTGQRPVK